MKAITLYLALTLAAFLGAANAAVPKDAVLDTDGDPLLPNATYYVLPAANDGGGLTLANPNITTLTLCPLEVVQSKLSIDNGFRVVFSNWLTSEDYVPKSLDLNIETIPDLNLTICLQRAYWQLGKRDTQSKRRFVTTSSSGGSIRNGFQIVKLSGEASYKFRFSNIDVRVVSNVGIFTDKVGIRRLFLNDDERIQPYKVVFQKADN